MEYKIVQAVNADALAIEVNKLLKEGWKVTGGVATSTQMSMVMFYQALYK